MESVDGLSDGTYGIERPIGQWAWVRASPVNSALFRQWLKPLATKAYENFAKTYRVPDSEAVWTPSADAYLYKLRDDVTEWLERKGSGQGANSQRRKIYENAEELSQRAGTFRTPGPDTDSRASKRHTTWKSDHSRSWKGGGWDSSSNASTDRWSRHGWWQYDQSNKRQNTGSSSSSSSGAHLAPASYRPPPQAPVLTPPPRPQHATASRSDSPYDSNKIARSGTSTAPTTDIRRRDSENQRGSDGSTWNWGNNSWHRR